MKLKKLSPVFLAIGTLVASGCLSDSDTTIETIEEDINNSLDSLEDVASDYVDTLIMEGLRELGLEELGGIFMDSSEYEEIPDTVIVVPEDPDPVDPKPVDPKDPDPVDPEPESQFKSKDLSVYFPPIWSQGTQGSCTGWASSAIRSYYMNKEEDNTSPLTQKRFSPAYIYNRIKVDGCDGGSYTFWAAEFLVEEGDVFEEDSPYDQEQCSELNRELESKAAKYRLSEYKRIDHNIDQFKAWLDQGVPLLVSMIVDNNFMELNNVDDLYELKDVQGYGGGHAIVINGYTDSLNAFQFHNSWGEDWGNEGKVWVDYEATMQILKEAFVVLE